MDDFQIRDITTVTKDNLLRIYPVLKPIYEKHFRPQPRQRYVDFNQGVDARLFNENNVKLLASIAIRPLRIAFDDLKSRPAYENAVRLSVKEGIKDFSNYLLYNYKDTPEELYKVLKCFVERIGLDKLITLTKATIDNLLDYLIEIWRCENIIIH